MENKPKVLVPVEERSMVARAVCAWLNTYTEKPVKKIDFEYIGDSGITVSTVQSPYKVRQYIDGSYQAQYQFYLIYRSRPTTSDARLKMDEALERMAEWCTNSFPSLGGELVPVKVECSNGAVLVARYEDGSEDHQIMLNLIYEVNK